VDPEIVARCRERLIQVARARGTISYGELAQYLGVANQYVGGYLNVIYNELVIAQGSPDLTLLAVYSGTRYGRYNSRGEAAQSAAFDPNDPNQRALYDDDRECVYQHWM
jgi:hypothetical protein